MFSLTNRLYQLLPTATVTVALDEKISSRLKLIKLYLRWTKTDIRLESLMLMLCEKDLIDNVNIEFAGHACSRLKSRGVTTIFSQRKKDELLFYYGILTQQVL